MAPFLPLLILVPLCILAVPVGAVFVWSWIDFENHRDDPDYDPGM